MIVLVLRLDLISAMSPFDADFYAISAALDSSLLNIGP